MKPSASPIEGKDKMALQTQTGYIEIRYEDLPEVVEQLGKVYADWVADQILKE